jgi:hypothetical protein
MHIKIGGINIWNRWKKILFFEILYVIKGRKNSIRWFKYYSLFTYNSPNDHTNPAPLSVALFLVLTLCALQRQERLRLRMRAAAAAARAVLQTARAPHQSLAYDGTRYIWRWRWRRQDPVRWWRPCCPQLPLRVPLPLSCSRSSSTTAEQAFGHLPKMNNNLGPISVRDKNTLLPVGENNRD